MKKIINAKIITPYRILDEGYEVAFEGKKIVKVAKNIEGADEVIDAKGYYLSPGFIDLHVHGGAGYDFATADYDALKQAAYANARYGTTTSLAVTGSLLPSKIDEKIYAVLENISKYVENEHSGPCVHGIHFEGPIMADSHFYKPGDTLPEYKKEEYEPLIDKISGFKILTIAPNLKGAEEIVRYCVEHGIQASLGHGGQPTYDQFMKCVEAGANQITHIYSSMEGYYREDGIRYPGMVEDVLMSDTFVELLADNVHMSKELVNFVYQNKGVDKICLASDSHYRKEPLEKDEIPVKVLDIDGRKSVYGMTPMNYIIKCVVNDTNIPFVHAIQMATLNPAKALKIDDYKGKIAAGYDADIVIFDRNGIEIKYVAARGEEILNELK